MTAKAASGLAVLWLSRLLPKKLLESLGYLWPNSTNRQSEMAAGHRRRRRMAGHRRTVLAVVLMGEIEDALRALGGRGMGIYALADQCSHLLTPKLRRKLTHIRQLRNKAYHFGICSRELFDKDQSFFPREFVGECRTILTQLLEAKERQRSPAKLEELCTRCGNCALWEDLARGVSHVLDTMRRSPQLQHVQEAGIAALISFANSYYTHWTNDDEAALVTRIFETILSAMERFVSASEVQKGGSAALNQFTNAHLVQPLAQSAPDQICVRSAMIIHRLLSAVEAAMHAHPDNECVKQNCDDIMTYRLGWCRRVSGEPHSDVQRLSMRLLCVSWTLGGSSEFVSLES